MWGIWWCVVVQGDCGEVQVWIGWNGERFVIEGDWLVVQVVVLVGKYGEQWEVFVEVLVDYLCVLDFVWVVFVQVEQVGGVVDLVVEQDDCVDCCIVWLMCWLEGWEGGDLGMDVG